MIGETRTYTIPLDVTVKYTSKGYGLSHDDPGSPNEYDVTEIELGKTKVSGMCMNYLASAAEGAKLIDAIVREAEELADKDGDWDVRDPDYLRDAAE